MFSLFSFMYNPLVAEWMEEELTINAEIKKGEKRGDTLRKQHFFPTFAEYQGVF